MKLSKAKEKADHEIENNAHYRCFGNAEIADILSRTHALTIRNGYELEKIITEMTESHHIDDLDDFLSHQIMPVGTFIAVKKVVKASKTIRGNGVEPDFIVFQHIGSSQKCYVIELKDGCNFDTKKAEKEEANLKKFTTANKDQLRWFKVFSKVVGFNSKTQEEVRAGFKNKITLEQAMTGKEFCDLLDISYDDITETRARDREHNLGALVSELAQIPEVQSAVFAETCVQTKKDAPEGAPFCPTQGRATRGGIQISPRR